MPGNTVTINGVKELEFYVGDSKMKELLNWLNKNGYKEKRAVVEAVKEVDSANNIAKIFKKELSSDIDELSRVILKHFNTHPEFACTKEDSCGRSAPKVAAKILEEIANRTNETLPNIPID